MQVKPKRKEFHIEAGYLVDGSGDGLVDGSGNKLTWRSDYIHTTLDLQAEERGTNLLAEQKKTDLQAAERDTVLIAEPKRDDLQAAVDKELKDGR